MELREHKFQLIGNRFTAIIAVCLTGFFVAEDLRTVLSNAPHKSSWLIPLDSLPLPIWAAIALNLFFCVYMLWLGVWACRGTQGKERIVVAGFFTGALFGFSGPIKALSSPHAIVAIRSIQSAGMTVAFCAALLILLKSPAWQKSDTKTATRLLLFLGALLLFVFVVAALLYWTL